MCRDNLSDCENNLDRCKNRVCNPEILTKTEYKYLLAGAGLWGFISLLITFFTSADQMQKNSKDDWNTFLNILVVIIAVLGFIGL
jgi:DMSO/TMAO reductase YedYZ heme-binding membrane subunit